MRHIQFALVLLILGLMSLKGLAQDEVFSSDLETEKKPWTHLNFQNDPQDFQFAIITDRTGSPRPGIFEDAVMKLNWLMPEFVISVGDLIRGAKGKDSVKLKKQWDAHFERISPLKMPFFHLAGNHDIKANNQFQIKYWNKLFGAPYYSFTYQNVLFICLFTNEGTQVLSEEQVSYFEQILKENKDVRWTMVFMHHPLWRYPHMSNFEKIEKSLAERNYTVFAGHQHTYHHTEKNDRNYYVLATTGGGSPLLGNSFGMFDHITWVTMTDDGPILANIRLDGILPHDVANDETEQLTADLIRSINVKTDVFVDNEELFKEGRAFLTYDNASDLPLHLAGRFFHNHRVSATPDQISVKIPPRTTKSIEIQLKAIQPFNLKEEVKLDFEASLGYQLEDHPDFSLSGTVALPIESSTYPLLPTSEVAFLGEYLLEMSSTLPGTEIIYSLDGKDPDLDSPKYTQAIAIKKSTKVKARLITTDGKMSEISQAKFKSVKAGEGLVVKRYGYNQLGKFWTSLPDFARLQPESITVSKELDPVKAAGKKDQFALVYKGNIRASEKGSYTFKAISDDALRVLIDGKEVLSDPVKHKAREISGDISLTKGLHSIEIQYFQFKRNYALEISYISPSGKEESLSSKVLSYDREAF